MQTISKDSVKQNILRFVSTLFVVVFLGLAGCNNQAIWDSFNWDEAVWQ